MNGPSKPLTAAPSRWSISPFCLVVLGSLLAWVALFAAVNPSQQNFPLDDDWAFAHGAYRFAHGEGIDYRHWASMPELGQWLWATPFLWALGFNHVALRISTIVLSWLGLWAFYDLLRSDGTSRRLATLTCSALAVCPLFFLMQGTFLTDVPALTFGLLALAFYQRGFSRGDRRWAAAGCFMAVLGVMTRQNLITLVPVAWSISRKPFTRKPLWLALIVSPALVAVATYVWFQSRPDIGPVHPGLTPPDVMLLFPFLVVHYCGLAALPIIVLGSSAVSWRAYRRLAGALFVTAAYWFAFGMYLPYGGLFPYRHNLITPWGAFAGSSNEPLMPGALDRPIIMGLSVRIFLTILGCLAGAALLARATTRLRLPRPISPLVLLAAWQVPLILIAPKIHDRYLLMLLPGALALALPIREGGPRRRIIALGILVAWGSISTCLMHDWLSWNAARWHLGEDAKSRGIKPEDIEGGFEWDGWYTPALGSAVTDPPPGLTSPLLHRWFPHVTGRYALSFTPAVPDSVEIQRQAYRLWLTPGEHFMYLLKYEPGRTYRGN